MRLRLNHDLNAMILARGSSRAFLSRRLAFSFIRSRESFRSTSSLRDLKYFPCSVRGAQWYRAEGRMRVFRSNDDTENERERERERERETETRWEGMNGG